MSDEREREARAVLKVVRRIAPGTVATYGQVARLAGLPRRGRWVGRVLAGLPPHSDVPWHRVLGASGRISLPAGEGLEEQRELLRGEGVVVSEDGRVSLARHRWPPGSEPG